MKILRYTVPLAIVSMLSACGGGSDDGSPGTSLVSGVSSEGAAVAFTDHTEYATEATLTTASTDNPAVDLAIDLPNLADATEGSSTAFAASADAEKMPLLAEISRKLVLPSGSQASLIAGVTGNTTVYCDNGYFTAVYSIAREDGVPSTGDYAHATYNSCVFYLGEVGNSDSITLDGESAFYYHNVTGTIDSAYSSWSYDASYGANNFTMTITSLDPVTSASTTSWVKLSGGYRAAESYDAVTYDRTYGFTGDVLGLQIHDGETNEELSVLYTAFNQQATYNQSTEDFTASNNLTLSSNLVGGTIKLETTETFTEDGADVDAYPEAGSITVTGALGNRIRLTATGVNESEPDNARQEGALIEFDLDNATNPDWETSVPKVWADL